MLAVRGLIVTLALLFIWQAIVSLFHLPTYILPGPWLVFKAWYSNAALILNQAWPTLVEILLGWFFGITIGMLGALSMALFYPVRYWMMPILVISQAIPTFAIAPLLVLWFGYGLGSKIIVILLMLFFPVTSALYDGLRRTAPGWLDMANTMGSGKWRTVWHIRLPAALPALASGIRIATVFAPIGAIVGEWVGSSRGLGFLILNANARLQVDLMFASLFTIVIIALVLYFVVDKCLRWAIPWQPEQ